MIQLSNVYACIHFQSKGKQKGNSVNVQYFLVLYLVEHFIALHAAFADDVY